MSLKYLDFASSQRKVQLRDLMKHIEEFERSRINDEEMFSSGEKGGESRWEGERKEEADEVKQIVKDLSEDLKTEMFDQLQRVSHHTAVLLRHVFLQAEDNNMQMLVDFASLEDE
ncbi:hypothetical protein GUITHDRAFT_121648 [Guillardia theta CCMP2712]|uniref:Leucine zipper transcription factor-like protein 1 n=1 Tax=Guillardia theta (strain CCMP2712) TaxID=905079 RepID=L1I8L6_GUITC|nr:hypothetical protein GUITHDRAFT_121648 [Guillardia theta CCMP2712]EKX32190.1 hypothetical protein GUITHDRAFT_121648 [Guillardia theta CCMP2712]|eukprot:XP_005819170.1 hypothetical protein GUITHDRAFT_121648 [Guillardia theta CCMP2712]